MLSTPPGPILKPQIVVAFVGFWLIFLQSFGRDVNFDGAIVAQRAEGASRGVAERQTGPLVDHFWRRQPIPGQESGEEQICWLSQQISHQSQSFCDQE